MELVEVQKDGGVATVVVNRPDKLNALNGAVIFELIETFQGLGGDEDVGAVILTGAGEKAFIAGADIGELANQGVLDGKDNARHGQRLTTVIENLPKPVLAAINGYALGGGLEMALACDLRYASSNARLGLPEVSLGIIPGYGGTQRLPRLLGSGRALEMILTGDPLKAEEAAAIGLVNGVFAPSELLAGVRTVADKILSRGRTAVALAKQAVRRGIHLPMAEGLELESDLFGMVSSTEEMREGMSAFLEKRKPQW